MTSLHQSMPDSRMRTAHRSAGTSKRLSVAVSTAAIPAVILSSLALAQPAHAAPSLPAPRSVPQSLPQAVTAAPTAILIPASMVATRLPAAFAPMDRKVPASHTVKAGETVSAIAARYGLNTRSVLELNDLGPRTIIFPGQKIKLDRNASSSAKAESTKKSPSQKATASASSASRYTVKSGDTISAIAARHGQSMHEVLSLNGLNMRSIIFPGQVIKLSGATSSTESSKPAVKPEAKPKPAAPKPKPAPSSSSPSSYKVKAGDTISAIAARHNVSTSSVLSLNGLTVRSVIYPGQTIKLTKSSGSQVSTQSNDTTPIPADKPAKPAAPAKAASYTVKSGDTLSAIAARHSVSLSSLLQANKLKLSSVIYPGNKLAIPGKNAPVKETSTQSPTDLVPSNFLHYTYPQHVVAQANVNMAALLKAPSPTREQVQEIIVATAKKMGVPPSLALAHAFQESSFNHRSVSPANAIGTMQVIPSSGEWASQLVGRQLNLLDPYDNITAGVAIISALLRTSDSPDMAIASYYQGQWSVHHYGMYNDTKNYVASVKAHQQRFQ